MRNSAASPASAVTPVITDQTLLQLQHFAEFGRLSANLLHEISNPLTAAILYLEQSHDPSDPHIRQAQKSLRVLRRYIEAARQQVRQESTPLSFAVHSQIEQVKRVVTPLAKARAIQLVIEPAPRCRLTGDPVKFQQILTNLISNAIDAYRNDTTTSLGRPVRVHISTSDKHLIIKVVDWGEGISATQLPQLFQPFYSTKMSSGYGLGIGLTMVQDYVIGTFGGSINVTSSRRHGTQFTVQFPLTTASR